MFNWLKTKTDKINPDVPHHIKLVEGCFEPSESADVLLSLLNYKIRFHTVQLLNLKKEQTQDLEKSKNRIEELKMAKKQVTDLVLEARNKGLMLDIQSEIEIRTMPMATED